MKGKKPKYKKGWIKEVLILSWLKTSLKIGTAKRHLLELIQLIQTIFIPIFSIGCVIDFFKQMLKISAFYLEKQNILISKQNMI